jgi:hypothetical protein
MAKKKPKVITHSYTIYLKKYILKILLDTYAQTVGKDRVSCGGTLYINLERSALLTHGEGH